MYLRPPERGRVGHLAAFLETRNGSEGNNGGADGVVMSSA